jgi:hypothetical protein
METETPPSHPWKVRFGVSMAMLILAVLGMVVTDLKIDGSWLYWRIMTPVYALLSIGLSLYMRRKKLRDEIFTIWHEILHWIGLVLAIYLVSTLVQIGFISRFQAGVEVLILLAMATFLAGIYIESTFLVTGITLGLLVIGVGYLDQYLYAILIPLILIALVALFWTARRKINKKSSY